MLTQPPRFKCNSPFGGGIQGSSQPSPKFHTLSGVKGVSFLPIADCISTSPRLYDRAVVEAAPPPGGSPNAGLAKIRTYRSKRGKVLKHDIG